MNVLALNCGSATVKFRLVAVEPGATAAAGRVLAQGTETVHDADYARAINGALAAARAAGAIDAVGHRVVHGGARFVTPTRVDDELIGALKELQTLAPLHNRPSVAGIQACREALGDATPMVAVFDTAFHAGLPAAAATYAIPAELAARHGIRRFGFHGISYAWATARAAAMLGRRVEDIRIVALHLGSGCSAAAIRGGVSVETSMGLTPLEGLVMRTRSGDLDPALPNLLARVTGATPADVEGWLNRDSGLRGLAGGEGDMRELLAREASDARARLAIDVFCHRARKYLGAYLAVLEGADAVVFTAGIGEHEPEIRRRIAAGFEWCGLRLDARRNAATLTSDGLIGADGATVQALVVAADEERQIAAETATCLS